jgi:uncharacterized membrane protein YsdA (DUF1294 family)
MANVLLYYLIVINIVTFLVYGIDKAASKRGQSQTRLSYAEREQARPKVKLKAKQGNWRISEATLLMLAVIGGSIGALLGMKVWRHKTQCQRVHGLSQCDTDDAPVFSKVWQQLEEKITDAEACAAIALYIL